MSVPRIVPPGPAQAKADPMAPWYVEVRGHRDLLGLATSTLGLGIEYGDGDLSVLRLSVADLERLAAELSRRGSSLGPAIDRFVHPELRWAIRGGAIDLSAPCIMGIVNLTEDSFSGDGVGTDVTAAARLAGQLRDDGATVIDVGAESARADRPALDGPHEAALLSDVIESLVAEGHTVSADTYKPVVAEAAVAAGVHILNDISGLTQGSAVARIAAAAGTGYVLNYSYSVPKQRPEVPPVYEDVVAETNHWFEGRLDDLAKEQLDRASIAIDPGIAFGKSHDEDLQVLRRLGEFRVHGLPLLIAHSRKNFIGSVTGTEPGTRDLETHVVSALAYAAGARIFRVHDVAGTARALAMAAALATDAPGKYAPGDGSWPWKAGATAAHMTAGEPGEDPPSGQRW